MAKRATREAYGEALKKLAANNPNVVVLDADLSGSTKTIEFKKVCPERIFQCWYCRTKSYRNSSWFGYSR